jgi:hypothetical protein
MIRNQTKRNPRERVFNVTVNGRDQWNEPAGTRTAVETQHRMATEQFPGARVRVRECYLGGAKAKLKLREAEESDK